MSGVGSWGAVTVLTLLSSLWLGKLLPGGLSAAAPDGTHAVAGRLEGPGCGRVPPETAMVASASLITDEILIELLPEERLAAVSFVVDWPRATAAFGRFPPQLPRTWGTAEHLLRLGADLILLSEFNGSLPAPQLAAAGCCVAESRAPRSLDDVLRTIEWLGEVTGTSERAAHLTAALAGRLTRLPKPLPGSSPRAMVLHGALVYGGRTVQGDCLRRAGLINVAEELGISNAPALGSEVWVRLELDLLFVAADVPAPRPATPELLPAGIPWREARVASSGRIVAVPETWVGSLSHHAVRACEAYARFASGTPRPPDTRTAEPRLSQVAPDDAAVSEIATGGR